MEAPPMLSAGERISIATPEGIFTFIIDKPFAPFTKAVVLLARCPELGPDPAIVKIFDPRFLDERLVSDIQTPPRPWALDLERAAAALPPDAFNEDKLWGPDAFDEENLSGPDGPESSDEDHSDGEHEHEDVNEEGDADEDHNEEGGSRIRTAQDVSDGSDRHHSDDPPRMTKEAQALECAVMWEEHFRRLSAMCFESERNAYAHLRELQGTAIPRLYLVGTWLPPDERAIQLPALVMEYIPDAVTLGDVPGDVLDPEMCATLIRTIETFPSYGVYHGDLHNHNILFTPKERPQRAVVIDFGCSATREDFETEELWNFNVMAYNDGLRIRVALGRRKGVDLPPDVRAPPVEGSWPVPSVEPDRVPPASAVAEVA
ncbi:hypothetical protein C8Q74DRAFT_376561 [Fomes fomentarius]|nr:hypothetical protein C8Q74DRAFT_376561 [Fomes fomentarius]